MQSKQLAVQMSLNAKCISVCKVFASEVDLQAFDSALDTGTLAVAGLLARQVLGMLPIDVRLSVTRNADVSACALARRTGVANRLTLLVKRGDPNIALRLDIASKHLEAMTVFTHGYAGRCKVRNALEALCQRRIGFATMNRNNQASLFSEAGHRTLVVSIGIIGQNIQ